MFDIGFFELLLIAGVGLVVIGPERLPGAVRSVALQWAKLKRMFAHARAEVEREVGADDIRREIHNQNIMQELEANKRAMGESLENLQGSIEQVGSEVARSVEQDPTGPTSMEEIAGDGTETAASDAEEAEDLQDPEYPEHLHDFGEAGSPEWDADFEDGVPDESPEKSPEKSADPAAEETANNAAKKPAPDAGKD
ncbi:Sec-independent protein translocase protein TatB [Biformimicrobium ophioploci]|uniref:Sec-independent protein translocase protein TatB n=1 Tax=Biformimicrobium ophioploci TaxID=3036711 RepID=A0ABQ6LVU1_9GAMM|nr:Sec-independent protein translocase protein TatB [Microbulbifer sp. NKW57]GMG86219.1 hypothetical protein MNKW57_05400 [Microbulbifer sp. NKW57]